MDFAGRNDCSAELSYSSRSVSKHSTAVVNRASGAPLRNNADPNPGPKAHWPLAAVIHQYVATDEMVITMTV